MSGNKTLYTTVKCRSMTTKSEFVEMGERIWKVLNEAMNYKKRIRIALGESDIIVETGDVIITDNADVIDIRDNDYNFHIMIYPEDITEIWDSHYRKVLYKKEK